jgi:hypothetical protein
MNLSNLKRAPVDGLWRNASGAELALNQRGALISGTYRTRLGEARLGKAYAVTGWRDGRCLGFSVSWAPESDSLTTWAGLLGLGEAGEPVIDATFLLVSASLVRDQLGLAVKTDTQAWEAFRTQSVRFTRAPS